jgi:hypothetical protein
MVGVAHTWSEWQDSGEWCSRTRVCSRCEAKNSDSDHHWREADPELRVCDTCGLRHHIVDSKAVEAIRWSYNEFGATASGTVDGDWYEFPASDYSTKSRVGEQ